MTTAVSTTTAPPAISDRFNFVFSGNGRYGVCLRTDDDGVALERWTLTPEETRCQTIPDVAVDRGTHALALDDGRILLGGHSTADRHELALLQPVDGTFSPQRLGAIPPLWGGRLLPSPNPDQLGFLVTLDDLEHSTIWRILAPAGPAEPIMQVPGCLTGGVWLDDEARVLGINQILDGSRSSGITVDLVQGTWKRIWSVSGTSSDRILLYSLRSKLIIVSSNASGWERLGWGRLGDPTVHFPESVHRPGYAREALALDDRGERLLVHEVAGAVSRLLIHTPGLDGLELLAGPTGRISAPATWAGNLIRFRFSTPCRTPTIATVELGPAPRWSASCRTELDVQHGGPQAELITLEGPAGPIEAIVYGGPDWRQREHLVVALHGGPLSAWRFEFEPLFHCLSAHGVAVVAPNYRGSTGYGEEHLRAVIGNWGGPDLDDVLELGKSLNKDRRRHQLTGPVVLGLSYGAFLGLLAACHEPELWSGCVAVAPFLSGARLHHSADVAVRHRIEQLGGLRQIDDGFGPRDVLAACAGLSAPLLLMHGSKDGAVPVEQSRMLRRRLLELGRTEGADFDYVEVDSDHAGLVRDQPSDLNQRVVSFCRTRPRTSSHSAGKWNESVTHNRKRYHCGQL